MTSTTSSDGPRPADVLVVFGITGDLARVMTFRSLYRLEKRGLLTCPVVGVAADDWTMEQLLDRARTSIEQSGEVLDKVVFDRFAERLSYASGDFNDPATYERVGAAVSGAQTPVHYLAMPPSLFGTRRRRAAAAGLTTHARLVVEKPFGHDLASARALTTSSRPVHRRGAAVPGRPLPRQGAVEDLLVLRFANTILEPLWNREWIDHFEITMAEDFDVADRGSFYDAVGTVRDVVQNHLLQVLAYAAMEPPSRGDLTTIKDAQVGLFRAVVEADPAHYVRGQYEGYLDIDGVAKGSSTETYAALRLEIENWRWAGVPFFIRTGKRLPVTQTELRLVFKRPPRLGFGLAGHAEPNQLVVRLDPTTGIRIQVDAHRADVARIAPIELDMEFAAEGGEGPTPYEVLLHAAMNGQSTRFSRQDSIEETWRVMQPLLDAAPPVESYQPGTWGPKSADALVEGFGGWRTPWFPR